MKNMLADTLGNVCVRVTVDQEDDDLDDMSDALVFIDGLRATANLHFAASGA